MKLLLLNATANTGSTSRIVEDIGRLANVSGYESWFVYGRKNVGSELHTITIGSEMDYRWHGLESRLLDNHGFTSRNATRKFIGEIEP